MREDDICFHGWVNNTHRKTCTVGIRDLGKHPASMTFPPTQREQKTFHWNKENTEARRCESILLHEAAT